MCRYNCVLSLRDVWMLSFSIDSICFNDLQFLQIKLTVITSYKCKHYL